MQVKWLKMIRNVFLKYSTRKLNFIKLKSTKHSLPSDERYFFDENFNDIIHPGQTVTVTMTLTVIVIVKAQHFCQSDILKLRLSKIFLKYVAPKSIISDTYRSTEFRD